MRDTSCHGAVGTGAQKAAVAEEVNAIKAESM